MEVRDWGGWVARRGWGARPWLIAIFIVCQGRDGLHDPSKYTFFHFARGVWGVCHPGKCTFSHFAGVIGVYATLANRVFYGMSGSDVRCVPLANALFSILPGVIEVYATLANRSFWTLPGSNLRCVPLATRSF